ncbi:MAG: aldehyde dehydrogenase family protein [Rhodospirillales bacterium]
MASKRLKATGQLWIDDEWLDGAGTLPVADKFTGDVIAEVAVPDAQQVDDAVTAARNAFRADRLEPLDRHDILLATRDFLAEQKEIVLETMISETGFTRSDVEGDFNRCLHTLRISAEEATRISGEIVPINGARGQKGRIAYTVREPVGIVCAITPFNSPLNTVCHKIAPSFAAGNATILKPSLHTPVSSEYLCRSFEAAGMPHGMLNLLHGTGDDTGMALLKHPGIDYYTFTGSTRVGEIIQQYAGLRRTQLELGNISGTIICADADIVNAAKKCANAAFRKAGQVCTSVQRLYVQKPIVDAFKKALATHASKLTIGDPRDPATDIGPMISAEAADRAQSWISAAADKGAEIVIGGGRQGNCLEPTILSNVDVTMSVVCEEIFAPVVSIIPFDELDEAIDLVNATPFGLASGIFTSNVDTGMRASRRVKVGTFHINDTSSNRVDLMPYGGVKQSGFGKEGPKYAIHDMTDEKLVTIVPVG